MSAGLIHLHNVLRWVVLIAGVIAVVRALMANGKPYNRVPGTVFMASLHVEVLLGLILYFGVSGLTAAFRADPGAGMKVAMLRFYGVEHLLGMLVAAVLATIGSARARRATTDPARNKAAAVFFGIALLLILVTIPWPFRGDGVGRGLFPGMKAAPSETVTPTTMTPTSSTPPVVAPPVTVPPAG